MKQHEADERHHEDNRKEPTEFTRPENIFFFHRSNICIKTGYSFTKANAKFKSLDEILRQLRWYRNSNDHMRCKLVAW